jgi:hypothetical protein
MKKVLSILVLLIMVSCSETNKHEIKQDTLIVNDTCKIDTIIVDSTAK